MSADPEAPREEDARALFPEKGDTFDLISAPRFRRRIAGRFGPEA